MSSLGRPFALLWTAATVSALGDGMTIVAVPLFVASLTTDPLVVSGAVFATTLPYLLFSLLSGGLVDQLDRRRVMVTVDSLRAAAIGGLAVAVALDVASVPLLYTVGFLLGTGDTLYRSASLAVLPAIVPKESLERANGRLLASYTVVHGMASAPIGAFLFTVAAALPFLVDSVSFALSALLVALIAGSFRPVRDEALEGPRGSLPKEIFAGVRWLLSQRLLRTLAAAIGLLNVTLTAALAVLVLAATQRLGLGSVGYGLLFTVMAVGMLGGSLAGSWLVKRLTASVTLRAGFIIETLFHLVLATSTSPYAVGAAFAVFGVHAALFSVVALSVRQRLTPPSMMGRVNAAILFVMAGGNSLGALLGGALASTFGLTAPYWIGFGIGALATVLTWRVFSRRVVAEAYGTPHPAPKQTNAVEESTVDASASAYAGEAPAQTTR